MSDLAGGRTAAIGLALLALLACREEEQDRALGYQPGVYQGKAMPELDAETREALRARAENQDY
jgi:hypothetical protein